MDKRIESAMKDALDILHCAQYDNDHVLHRVHGCVVCDAVIKGTEPVCCMTSIQLEKHCERLGVNTYTTFHKILQYRLEWQ